MRTLLSVTFASIIYAAAFAQDNKVNPVDNTLSAQEKKDGWKLLFDGASTKGWHSYGHTSVANAWKVAEGTLYLDANNRKNWPANESHDLLTDDTFENFHLKADWKISKNGNSGLIFLVQEDKEKYRNTYETGLEMQVLDNAGHPDSKIHKHRAGDLYDLIPSSSEPVKPAGQWNRAEIICKNGKLNLLLNGVEVVSTTLWNDSWKQLVAGSKFKSMPGFGKSKQGKIALQEHGDEVWFKNIKIKLL